MKNGFKNPFFWSMAGLGVGALSGFLAPWLHSVTFGLVEDMILNFQGVIGSNPLFFLIAGCCFGAVGGGAYATARSFIMAAARLNVFLSSSMLESGYFMAVTGFFFAVTAVMFSKRHRAYQYLTWIVAGTAAGFVGGIVLSMAAGYLESSLNSLETGFQPGFAGKIFVMSLNGLLGGLLISRICKEADDPERLTGVRRLERAWLNYIKQGFALFMSNLEFSIGFFSLFSFISFFICNLHEWAWVANVLFVPVPAGIMFYLALKMMKGRDVVIKDCMIGFFFMLPLCLSGYMVAIILYLGLSLMVLPGMVMGIMLSFSLLAVIDRKKRAFAAMRFSMEFTSDHLGQLGLFFLALIIINSVAMLAGFLGLMVTVPVSFFSIAAAYDDIAGVNTAFF